MERTVPSATTEEIRLYRTTLYSLLRSTTEVQVRTLEEVHAAMNSLLHPNAHQITLDTSAFIYSLLRLPDCMPQVRSVVLGQSDEVFALHGYPEVESWQAVSARARRRRCFFSNEGVLACYIASRSDIEDILPCLTAFQIEWNKLRVLLLANWPRDRALSEAEETQAGFNDLAMALQMSVEDLERLKTVWWGCFSCNLEEVRKAKCSLGVRLLAGSFSSYQRATHAWWEEVRRAIPEIQKRPVYFISSNTHSLANLLTGFAQEKEDELVDYIQGGSNPDLMEEWRSIQTGQVRSSLENFLYYALKKYQQTEKGAPLIQAQLDAELAAGIQRVPSKLTFDIEAQVFDLSCLNFERLDPRLQGRVGRC